VKKGDHIYVGLGSLKQHGIYIDESLVIYWTDRNSRSGQVFQDSLADFTQGKEPKTRKYSCRCIDREKTIEKAKSRLEEEKLKYKFLNSKDFAIYCRTGLKMGDHISADYDHVFHHGIYCGNDEVIHYVNGIEIRKTPLSKFAETQRIYIKSYHRSFSQSRVVKRAERRLGERKYNLAFNNCEHFATWCKTGKSRCEQGEKIIWTGGKAAEYGIELAVKEAETTQRKIKREVSQIQEQAAREALRIGTKTVKEADRLKKNIEKGASKVLKKFRLW
jgi:hypothetical protein